MKNILVIPQGFPNDAQPNLTPFIFEHVVALKKQNYSVCVLYVRILSIKNISKLSHGFRQYRYKDVEVFETDIVEIKGFEKVTTYLYNKALKKLYCLYKSCNAKPDCFEAHFSQYAGYGATRLSIEENIPLVCIEHAGWLLKSIPDYQKKKIRTVLEKSEKFVCVSNKLRQSILSQISISDANKVVVIPNMIENRFSYYPARMHKNEEFCFFSAGNLYEGKRFDLLVRAFCTAFSKDSSVVLRIAGDGNQRSFIEQIIRENGRNDQVKLLGSLNKPQMLEQYINCDCFVLASEHETFGIVYREAMAVGRPIITTNHQGFSDDWDDSYGIRIEIDDERQLSAALRYMKDNIRSYEGRTISSICKEKYSEEKVMAKYCDIISSL